MADRLDRMQQRRRPVGFVLGVAYKYFDDQGGYLAALITYYGFVSLFPLLLLLTTVTGIVLDGQPDLQQQLLDSALSQFPVIGDQLSQPRELSGGPAAITIGVIVALYGGLGVGLAVQNASNVAWAVPRNERPDPIRSRLRSVRLLLTVGLGLFGIAAITNISAAVAEYGRWTTIGVTLLSLLLDFGIFVVALRISVARSVGFSDVAVGAAVAAVGWQVLQQFGYIFVTNVVQRASTTNGVFAVVLGLLAFIYLAAVLVVVSIEINTVRVKRLYPRSLLTPFTDDVDLTAGDRRVYRGVAQAQRNKSFQQVDVTFDRNREPSPTPAEQDDKD
jgi:membrane protein